jgi:hypothetical protein
MMAETNPTPKPAIRRPATNKPKELLAVCKIHPIPYTIHPRITVVLRPNQSARSPAMMAPKNVPALRIETMRDLCGVGITNAATVAAEASGPGIGIPVKREMK